MKLLHGIVCAALLLSGCAVSTFPERTVNGVGVNYVLTDADKAKAQAFISATLKDPDSAKYRWGQATRLANGDVLTCVDVNAKNSMGGYVGFGAAHLLLHQDGTVSQSGGWVRNPLGGLTISPGFTC